MIAETEIINEAGQVALKYNRQAPQSIKVHGNYYLFSIRANISMAWVAPEDIEAILETKRDCGCGGNGMVKVFFYANESDVRRWTNGGGS